MREGIFIPILYMRKLRFKKIVLYKVTQLVNGGEVETGLELKTLTLKPVPITIILFWMQLPFSTAIFYLVSLSTVMLPLIHATPLF